MLRGYSTKFSILGSTRSSVQFKFVYKVCLFINSLGKVCFGAYGGFLVSILVLNPDSLAARGLISETEGRRLSAIIGATPMTTGPDGDVEELRSAARTLQGDARIKDAIMKELSLTNEKTKRGWERVGKAIITLEPFSVVNGQLTQTLKVKRDAVVKRYAEDIRVAYVN